MYVCMSNVITGALKRREFSLAEVRPQKRMCERPEGSEGARSRRGLDDEWRRTPREPGASVPHRRAENLPGCAETERLRMPDERALPSSRGEAGQKRDVRGQAAVGVTHLRGAEGATLPIPCLQRKHPILNQTFKMSHSHL